MTNQPQSIDDDKELDKILGYVAYHGTTLTTEAMRRKA